MPIVLPAEASAATYWGTPGAGYANFGLDNTAKRLKTKDDGGSVLLYKTVINNYSTTSQNMAAASRTYLTGSALTVPSTKLQIGTVLRWTFNMTKTSAGVATSTFDIAFGTAGTTADTARVSFTKPAGTGVADEAYCIIEAICRGPLSASGIVVGEFVLMHNLAATGHAQIPIVCVNTVSSAFDVTVANLIAGICVTPGSSDSLTFQQVYATCENL